MMKEWITAVQFVLLGITNSIIEKAIYQQKSRGIPIYGDNLRYFNKPWFFNTVSLASMISSLLLYIILRYIQPTKYKSIKSVSIHSYLLLFLPGIFDIFQHITSSITVLFVGVSIEQMFRGGTIVITALISKVRFKRTYSGYIWCGMLIIVMSLLLVGLAAILNSKNEMNSNRVNTVSPGMTTLILFLKVLSLFGYSFKLVIEEEVVTKRNIHHILAVGLEGSWSTILSICIFMPIFHNIRGEEGRGLHEDTIDTFEMMKNNHTIIILLTSVFITFCFYNNVSMNLTGQVSAVTRLVIDCLRTFILWIIQLIIYYSFNASNKLHQFRFIGEPWKKYSYIQLLGFAMMILGILIYHKTIKLPWFKYPQPEDEFTRLLENHNEGVIEYVNEEEE
ncbi:hypothetical protein TRFO_23236 [Tritrichomonas foetus]|uniref:Integral membrane protein n=1 Tax=Tritrichomonas foetus TaxID=1144522 RepID=A0A1J4KEQ9_9EUKA|nr:hypothetical protein TRFO_23236 [Tritrichomonas foetus]|eukprot:OHT08244.1 hypothetical protein TRFO_23236 [Tritrichomonas foetus]